MDRREEEPKASRKAGPKDKSDGVQFTDYMHAGTTPVFALYQPFQALLAMRPGLPQSLRSWLLHHFQFGAVLPLDAPQEVMDAFCVTQSVFLCATKSLKVSLTHARHHTVRWHVVLGKFTMCAHPTPTVSCAGTA